MNETDSAQDEDACVSPLTCFPSLVLHQRQSSPEDLHNPKVSCHEKQAVSLSSVSRDPQHEHRQYLLFLESRTQKES